MFRFPEPALLVPFAILSSVAMYEMDRNTRTDIERTIGGKVDACLAGAPHGWLRNSNPIQHLDRVQFETRRIPIQIFALWAALEG